MYRDVDENCVTVSCLKFQMKLGSAFGAFLDPVADKVPFPFPIVKN